MIIRILMIMTIISENIRDIDENELNWTFEKIYN